MTDDDLADFNAAVAAVLACDEPVSDTLIVSARFAPMFDALHRAHAAGDTEALDAIRADAFAGLAREHERGALLTAEVEAPMNDLVSVARAALTRHGDAKGCPTLTLLVRRDVRLYGPKRTRFVGGWHRGTTETYRHEQTRFDFAPTEVLERVEVAVIDETCGALRFELASEQHLWDTHRSWSHDPVPTVLADVDDDGQLEARAPYAVQDLAL